MASRALLGIINDMLDFSKIEAGKLALEAVDFDLDDLLRDVKVLIGPKAPEKGHRAGDPAAASIPSR